MENVELHEDHFARAVFKLRRTSGVPLTFGGVVTGDTLRVATLSGTATSLLSGLVVKPHKGLGGKALATRRVALVNDYTQNCHISHDFDYIVDVEGIHSLVAVPVIVRRRLRAVIYAGTRGRLPMGGRAVDAVVDLARDVEQDIVVAEEGVAAESVRACTLTAGDLTPRELDVLRVVARGLTNAEVAAELGIGAETVKTYLANAAHKLGCHRRLQAVSIARAAGLLP